MGPENEKEVKERLSSQRESSKGKHDIDAGAKQRKEEGPKMKEKELIKAMPSQTARERSGKEILKMKTFSIGINKLASYKYVDTDHKFGTTMEDLHKAIKQGEILAVDCEGVKLSRFVWAR